MDAYIHCIESMAGILETQLAMRILLRHLSYVVRSFFSDNIMSAQNREKLMVASYMGGCAIASSFVGLIHPFSAGLSVVLGTHHCLANCIIINSMNDFYPEECEEFKMMANKQKINPNKICKDLSVEKLNKLYECTIIHDGNALGENFKKILLKIKLSIFSEVVTVYFLTICLHRKSLVEHYIFNFM